MIASHDVSVDLRRLDRLAQSLGDEEVVDSPANVARPRVGEVTPPAVVAVTLLEEAQRIDEAGIDEVLESLPLLIGKAFLAPVGFGIGEIELRMRDVEIAAESHGLFLLELLHVGEKRRVP